MARYSNSVTDQNGVPLPGALVLVQNSVDGTLATLTADDTSPLPNPLTADVAGGFAFNVAPNYYDVTYTYGGRQIFRDRRISLGTAVVPAGSIIDSLGNSTIAAASQRVVTAALAPIAGKVDTSALALATGSALVGYSANGTGAVSRTLQAKIREQWVSVTDFGAVADSNGTPGNGTDNLAAFNAAFAAAQSSGVRRIFVPAAPSGLSYRMTDCWNITQGVSVFGAGVVPQVGSTPGTRGGGSWMFLDHSFVGARLYNFDLGQITGGAFTGIGFFRTQPAFTSGWAPANHDYDLMCLQGEWYIDDICFWNSTKALLHTYGGQGRMRVGHVYGNPFRAGIVIDQAYDVVRIGSVHWWPYSTFNADAATYKFQNFIPLEVGHCDGVFINDFFYINGKNILLRLGADSQPPRDVKFGRLYCDLVGYAGIVADSTAVGGSFSVDQLIVQGAISGGAGVGDGNPGQPYVGVVIAANNFIGKIGHVRFTRFSQQMALVSGNNSTLYVGPDTIDQWNMGGVSASAYAAPGSGSKIIKTGPSTVLTSGGSIGDGSGKVTQPTMVGI